MKPVPMIIAALVCVALYFVILDRETLVSFAARFGPDAEETGEAATPPETLAETAEAGLVHVTVRRSEQQIAENAVLLRGRTEAARSVD
ncbi:MAG: efflux RND transporter periplasmic adaptor subunit, partial [Roseicyclus sp.]